MSEATYKVGDTFTTMKSRVTGIIKEITPIDKKTTRLLLDVNGKDRYTTFRVK